MDSQDTKETLIKRITENHDVKIFTENIEEEALRQIEALLAIGTFRDCKIRIMPDVHAGAGCVIGFTGNLGDKVIPNIVGVDIGCGILVQPFSCMGTIDFHALNAFILSAIPSGRNFRGENYKPLPHTYMEMYSEAKEIIKQLRCYRELKETKRLNKAIGTLGGGNHFIELDKDEIGFVYLVVHTGSRNLGKQVAQIYQKLALKCQSGWATLMEKQTEMIEAYKRAGRKSELQEAIRNLHNSFKMYKPSIPAELSYLEKEFREDYLHDMRLCQHWAKLNRRLITDLIMDYFLHDFFGDYTEEAKNRFLYVRGPGRYGLKEEYDTQAKVVKYFSNLEADEKNEKLKNALLGLIDEVLFIEDAEQKGKYHPRISAQFTYIYRSLNDYERWCFNRLYNDFFYHRHNDFWYGKAMWKLQPLIGATDMLVCGEDLGMIPDCVPAVMDKLQILSLEIQRMPKDPKMEFGNPLLYPYMSVCTTSTHDMPGIRAWWEANHEKTQHFFNYMMHEWGNAPYYAEPWICERIVAMHLNSPAMLTILPLQDWLAIDGKIRRENPNDEQINNPSNNHHYWRYRMHLTIEELMECNGFNDKIKSMITGSGR